VSDPTASRERWLDAGLALALFAGVVLHQRALPPSLGAADESYFFYHGRRVLEGQVPYRDFQDLVTPLTFYLVAAVFGLFGTTMQVGRLLTAAVDGGVAVALLAACRILGAPRGLAVAAPIAQVVLFQPAWPFGSPHWLATLLTMGLLIGLLRPLVRGTAPPAVLLGIVSGALVLTAQQRATALAVGVPFLVLLDDLVARAFGREPPIRRRLAWFVRYVAAGALVVVPGLGLVVAAAGFTPVWEALVMYPLRNYAATIHAGRWGAVAYYTASHARETFPAVLRWLPLALAVDVARLVAAVWRRDVDRTRRLVLLLAFSALVVASIWYYHDFIHIAFVAPVLLVAVVELLDAAARALPWPRAVTAALAAAVLAVTLVHGMRIHAARARALPVRHETAFGEVALPNTGFARLVDRVRELAATAGTDELFSYPSNARFYLLTGLRNPTRFSWVQYGYSQAEAYAEVFRALEQHQTPIVLVTAPFLKPDDPFLAWLTPRYTRLEDPDTELATGVVVYARGPLATNAPPPSAD
jgi:hypothetical protein